MGNKNTKSSTGRLSWMLSGVLKNKKAEGFVDTAVKVLIAVVIGALLLFGLYGLFSDIVIPTTTSKVSSLFGYSATAAGGNPGGGTGGDPEVTALNVYCWGDSLTANTSISYANYLQKLFDASSVSMTTKNCGIAGEGSQQIAARQGGYPLYVRACTIPASGSVTVRFTENISLMYNAVDGIFDPNDTRLQINPVTINGIEGTLSRQSSSNYDYTFTRSTDGEAVSVAENTQLFTYASQNDHDGIAIIWIGTNDTAIDTIISNQEKIINSLGHDRYIVLGLISDGMDKFSTTLPEYNAALKAKWGNHFLDICDLMKTANIDTQMSIYAKTVPEADRALMTSGKVPNCYFMDARTHLNTYGQQAVAGYIFDKGIELGYWNTVAGSEDSVFEFSTEDLSFPFAQFNSSIAGKATITGLKTGANLSSVEIKSSYRINGKTYAVTSIEDSVWDALADNVEEMTINANILDSNRLPIGRKSGQDGTPGYNVSSAQSAYKGFNKLKKITLSKSIMSLPTAMFAGNTSIEKVVFDTPDFTGTTAFSVFNFCTKLKTISGIPESITVFNGTFRGCKSLTGTLTFRNANATFANGCFSDALSINNVSFRVKSGGSAYTFFEDLVNNKLTGTGNTLTAI